MVGRSTRAPARLASVKAFAGQPARMIECPWRWEVGARTLSLGVPTPRYKRMMWFSVFVDLLGLFSVFGLTLVFSHGRMGLCGLAILHRMIQKFAIFHDF